MQTPQIWRTLEHKTILIEHALPSKYIAYHSGKNTLLDMLALYLATLTVLTKALIRMQDQNHGAKSSLAPLQSGSLLVLRRHSDAPLAQAAVVLRRFISRMP